MGGPEWNARSRAAGLIAKKSGVGVPAAVTSLVLLVGGVATAWYHRCNAEAVRAEFQRGILSLGFAQSIASGVAAAFLSGLCVVLGVQGLLAILHEVVAAIAPPSKADAAPAKTGPAPPKVPDTPMVLSLRSPPITPQSPGAAGPPASPGLLSSPLPHTPLFFPSDLRAFPLTSPQRGAPPSPSVTPDAGVSAPSTEAQASRARATTPKYCPSPPPRAEARQLEDQSTLPSTHEEFLAVLDEWGLTEEELELWAEDLRDWLVSHVIRPLMHKAAVAHEDVSRWSGRLGVEGALRPLVQTPPDGASEGPLLEDAGPGVSEEDVALCQQLRVAAEQQLAQRQSKQSTSLFGFKPQATNEDREALEAVRKLVAALEAYDALARVLRGSFVPGLLGPVPPGYVSARLRVLARDRSPLQAFQWDAGMTWAGRAWRAGSMPTDSALLLYVLACFLDAPDWDFVARAEHRRPGAAPLFLGHLPHGTVPGTMQYSAILEGAQAPRTGVAHALVLDKSVHPPQFQLMVAGKLVLVLGGKDGRMGFFFSVLLWLWYAQKHFRGWLGDLSLASSLHVAHVFSTQRQHVLSRFRQLIGA